MSGSSTGNSARAAARCWINCSRRPAWMQPRSRLRTRGLGHLAAAYCVVSGDADACLATRSAARAFGLDFIPLRSERYDLVMRRRTADLPAVKAFLDVLQRATLRRKLEVLAGYDTSQMGTLVA